MPIKPDWLPTAAYATTKGWVVAHPDGTEEVMIAVNGLLPYVPPVVVVEPTPTVNVQAVRFGEINGQSVVKIFFSGATIVTGTASIELKSFKETITVSHSAFLSTPTTLVFPFNVPANTLGLTILEQEIKGQIQDLGLNGVGKKITKEMAIDASSSDVVSNVMVGATSTFDGVIGYVPRPVAGDDARFLRGDGTWQAASGSGGTSDHGALTGLADDDHPQYLNTARGDARYSQSAHVHAASELTEDASNRLVTDAEKTFWNGKQSALGFIPEEAANKGIAGGYASLNGAGKVPSDQLPSYIDDVLEFATLATLPIPGLSDTIYLTLSDDKTYRWSGSSYVQIATGVVDSVAGKTGLVTLDKYDVGLGNIDNTADLDKPISTATQAAINAIPAGVTSHGSLTGLGNDDHSQYHNDARGDVRYSQLTHNHTGVYQPLNPVLTNTTASFTVADETKLDTIEANYQPLRPVLTNTTASFTTADETKLDGLGSHSTLTGLSGDDHPQYMNNTRGDARYQPLNPVLTATTASFTTADETKLDALAPMVGATALVAGVTGTVPTPAAGDQDKFLKADGTWAITGSLTNLTYGRVNAFTAIPATLFVSTGSGTKVPFVNGVYSSGMTYGAGNAGLIPSVAGRFRASWLMMCGSEEFLDDGYFHVVQNGVSLGQVKYNMMQSAGVNQCSGFIDVNLAAGQEVSLHYRSENAGGDNLQWNVGSYFDIYQLPVAVSTVGDTTPTNDQVPNKYFDVGTMRMQWGTHNDGNVDTTTVTLPAPFASAVYVVTCSNSSGGSLSTAIEAKTAGSFDIDRSSSATTTQSWDWIAIGTKP